ncbi:hypothetical protein SAMN05443245_0309 [Paraburkholderia fungorum]|uniref:Uncharacterized protein n=1 Tax=Paraburkholderia fungorum TaxID=134537 RepID=A0A1H0YW02_9BURK|nr:hypothetical protein SAMN05443245_0309 [Paraburkholderia fungorum]
MRLEPRKQTSVRRKRGDRPGRAAAWRLRRLIRPGHDEPSCDISVKRYHQIGPTLSCLRQPFHSLLRVLINGTARPRRVSGNVDADYHENQARAQSNWRARHDAGHVSVSLVRDHRRSKRPLSLRRGVSIPHCRRCINLQVPMTAARMDVASQKLTYQMPLPPAIFPTDKRESALSTASFQTATPGVRPCVDQTQECPPEPSGASSADHRRPSNNPLHRG